MHYKKILRSLISQSFMWIKYLHRAVNSVPHENFPTIIAVVMVVWWHCFEINYLSNTNVKYATFDCELTDNQQTINSPPLPKVSSIKITLRTPLNLLHCTSDVTSCSAIVHHNVSYAVAALAIDKVGPRPYHFRSGPTSGPTTRPGSKKSKISMVHSLAVLKGHPECLKCRKALWRRPGLSPGPRWGSLQRSPRPSSWWGCPLPENPPPLSVLRASNLGPSGLDPCLPKSVYQNPPM